MNISPEELVKALNQLCVVVQDDKESNVKTLAYNARVHTILGEKVIVIETFR